MLEGQVDNLIQIVHAQLDCARGMLHWEGPRGYRYLLRVTQNSMLILIINFIDSLLDEVKQLLDLGDDFYDSVRSAHHRILQSLVANDSAGARKTMMEDVLEVGSLHLKTGRGAV